MNFDLSLIARPATTSAGRVLLWAMLAVFAMGPKNFAAAENGFVDPRSITPAPSNGEVPEPDDYRTNDYRMPVPRTLNGARVVSADEAETLLAEKASVFLDVYPRAPRPPNLPAGTVWRDPPHSTIADAHWLPNVGYGVLSPDFETYFKTRLEKLTGQDKSKPIVFFCLKDCWMSWNAAKRALAWGYTSVLWFPEGTDGWQAIGNDLVPATPVP